MGLNEVEGVPAGTTGTWWVTSIETRSSGTVTISDASTE